MTEIKKEISELTINTSIPKPEQPKIITYTDFKVISTEKKGRVTTALTVKLSAVSPSPTPGSGKDSVPVLNEEKKDDGEKDGNKESASISPIARNVIKLDLTNKRHPKYIPPVAISSNGRVSPGLLADPGEELLIQKIIQNHKKYSRDYLMGLRESKKALQLPVGLPNIPDLLPTSKQVIIVQTNSNAGPHKSNHHKQGHHHHNNNNHHNNQNNNNNSNNNNNYHNHHHHQNNQGTGHHHNNNQHHGHGHQNQGNQHHNTGYHNNANNQSNYHNNRRNTVGAIHNNHHGQNSNNNNYQNNNYNKYYNNQHHNNHFNQSYNKNKHHVHNTNNNNNNNNNSTNQG